jgi:hypothetical protein
MVCRRQVRREGMSVSPNENGPLRGRHRMAVERGDFSIGPGGRTSDSLM